MRKHIEWLNARIEQYYSKDRKYWEEMRLLYKNMGEFELIDPTKVSALSITVNGKVLNIKSKEAAQKIVKLAHAPMKGYFILEGKVYEREEESLIYGKPKPFKNEKQLHDIVKKFIFFVIDANPKMKVIDRNKLIATHLNAAISKHSEDLYTTEAIRKIIKKGNLTPLK